MAEAVTAQIIPFPRPVAAAVPAAENPQRLSNALTSLAQAMADQQEAVAAWRKAVKDLASQMQSLSTNLAGTKLTIAKTD